jgi:hypothetical protein
LISLAAPGPTEFDPTFGPYGSTEWRRFAMAAFVADWACYETPADRADFPRLLSVIASFPVGFRLWLCKLTSGRYVPVGYTGWYPISRNIFTLLHDQPDTIKHRGFMVPLQMITPDANFVYLFNYSIVSQLHRSRHSSNLIKSYAAEIAAAAPHALAAVTVSEDGARVAQRFGLTRTGSMVFQGEVENVYAGFVRQ